MKTNDIFLKFQSNHSKLESVLYNKKISSDVKNLLLNMLYNIENSYNDYANIKVNVEEKNKFIGNIISIIDKCDNIELVKPSSEEGMRFIQNGLTCEVNTYSKYIKVFPTERDMLYALFKINDTKMFLDEKYHLLRIALPEMLNEGRDINNIEIIRDFNAWSWNTLANEISNIECNLVYQNLQMLLGFEFLDNWMKKEKQKEMLENLEEELKKSYSSEYVNKLMDSIYRVSLLVCVERNKKEKQRLLDEKMWDQKEFDRLSDKTNLVLELTAIKKKKAREIKRIDKILNDDSLMLKEFDKRNKNLSEYKKIYSIENLEGTLKKERKKALNEIDECNNLLDAKYYVAKKNELEKNLNLLNVIDKPKSIKKYKITIQKNFIKCMKEKLEKITDTEQKKEAIAIMRMIRYYNFVLYDEEKFIKDVEELKEDITDLEGKVLMKLFDIKALNSITKNLETDMGIVMPIFDTRIMNLENVYINTMLQEDKIRVQVFDGSVLELEYTIDNLNGIEIKSKKKIRLFAK